MNQGWSSVRGRARHLVKDLRALCGSPIRLMATDGLAKTTAKRLRRLEVCDWCEHARRRAKIGR